MDTNLLDLLQKLGSDNGMVRKQARETIVLIGEPAAPEVRTLVKNSKDKRVRWEATKALAMIADPASIDTFIKLLTAYESDLRWIAADGLIRLGNCAIVPLLKSLLVKEIPKGQSEMSARVLRQLSSDNDVLGRIVSPVISSLKNPQSDILQPKVERALSDLSTVTGELPIM